MEAKVNQMINDKRKVLGRGLDSLLPGKPVGQASAPAVNAAPQEIAIDLIDANPYQTRRKIREEAMSELVESIKATGVIQPVVLRPGVNGRYQLVAGERR